MNIFYRRNFLFWIKKKRVILRRFVIENIDQIFSKCFSLGTHYGSSRFRREVKAYWWALIKLRESIVYTLCCLWYLQIAIISRYLAHRRFAAKLDSRRERHQDESPSLCSERSYPVISLKISFGPDSLRRNNEELFIVHWSPSQLLAV